MPAPFKSPLAPLSNQARAIPLPDDVSLLPGEKVVRVANFHWGIYWKGLAILALTLILTILGLPRNLGLFLCAVAAIKLFVSYLVRTYLLLILTNKRLLIRTGLIRMDTIQLPLERVESVELERTIPAMLLGYAAVVITGTGSRVMAVPYVDQPQVFRRLADERIYALNATANGPGEAGGAEQTPPVSMESAD